MPLDDQTLKLTLSSNGTQETKAFDLVVWITQSSVFIKYLQQNSLYSKGGSES